MAKTQLKLILCNEEKDIELELLPELVPLLRPNSVIVIKDDDEERLFKLSPVPYALRLDLTDPEKPTITISGNYIG